MHIFSVCIIFPKTKVDPAATETPPIVPHVSWHDHALSDERSWPAATETPPIVPHVSWHDHALSDERNWKATRNRVHKLIKENEKKQCKWLLFTESSLYNLKTTHERKRYTEKASYS